MFDRSGIGSEVVAQNSIPDDPYQTGDDEPRYILIPMNPFGIKYLTPPSESLPGTPIQSAPDYVLNPLSIFRMARKSIPERHAPEKATTSSAPNSAIPESNADPTSGPPTQEPTAGSSGDMELGQASLEELQTLFMSDLGWTWQPADTAVGSGIEGAGLMPWAGGYPVTQAEPWLPVFPFPQQS